MILTDTKGNGHMVLTPTYHVFRMYQPFQDATYLPIDIKCDSMKVRDNRTIPMVSASAAKAKDGNMVISLANVSLDKAQNIDVDVENADIKNINGEILTSKNIGDYNDFNHPEIVKPVPFKDVKIKKNTLKVKIPAKSIVVLNIK
jgi:alpha-N-arabinofuranosidase